MGPSNVYQWLSVCLVHRIALWAPAASVRATSRARSRTSSSSTHSETHPMRSASAAARGSPAEALGSRAREGLAREQVVLGLGHPAQQRPADGGVIAGRDAEPG